MPDDEQSVRSLADGVLSFPRPYPRLDAQIEELIKSRLAQAEIKYRHGSEHGVQEADIVALLNEFADKLQLPPYAKTSISQLRVLRMRLALAEPKFMGLGLARQDSKVGDSLNTEMSPLQGLHLIETLIDQKVGNPEFQVSPGDWDKNLRNSILPSPSGLLGKGPQSVVADSTITGRLYLQHSPRMREMYNTLQRNLSSMNSFEALQLLDHACVVLKIR
jgi:hypothetical protein